MDYFNTGFRGGSRAAATFKMESQTAPSWMLQQP